MILQIRMYCTFTLFQESVCHNKLTYSIPERIYESKRILWCKSRDRGLGYGRQRWHGGCCHLFKTHVFEDGTVAFLLRERLTYHNVQENPYVTYLFVEGGTGYSGIRLYLKRIKEDNDSDLIARMTRSGLSPQEDKAKGPKHLVHFKIEKILQLIGSEKADIKIR